MDDSVAVHVTWWPHRGWVGSVFHEDHTTGRRIHWVTPGTYEDCTVVAREVGYALMMWAASGELGLGQATDGWDYTVDGESAAATAAAALSGLEQK